MLSAGLPCLRTARIHLVVPDLCVVHGQDVLCRLWCTARPGQILQDQPGFFVSISQQDSLPRRKCRSAWCFLFFLNLGVEDSSRERATSAITYRVLHVARNFWSMKRRYSAAGFGLHIRLAFSSGAAHHLRWADLAAIWNGLAGRLAPPRWEPPLPADFGADWLSAVPRSAVGPT